MAFPLSARSVIVPLLLIAPLAGCDRHNQTAPQATAGENADIAMANATTPMGATGRLDRSHKGDTASSVAFTGPDGHPISLPAFKGKPVLLNLWATWCAPCVKEMPTLDAAAAAMTVVAVSQDLGADGAAKAKAFFARERLAHLKPYTDPDATLSIAYQTELPTSILYDSTGREVWRSSGGMDWTSAEAKALLAEAK